MTVKHSRNNRRLVSRWLGLSLTMSAVFGGSASADTFTWTGVAGQSWSASDNWDAGIPNSAIDTAIVFDSAGTSNSTMDIPGGLTLNSITFTANAGPREIIAVAGRSLIFDGTAPFINHFNQTGGGLTALLPTVTVNQTLTLNGVNSFDRQFIFGSTAVISGIGGITVQSGVFATNAANAYSGPTLITGGLWGASNSGSFGNTSSVTVQSGGGLQLFGTGTMNVNRPLFLSGSGDGTITTYALAASSGAGNSNGGTKAWAGAVTLLGASTLRSFSGSALALTGLDPLDLNGHTVTFATSASSQDAITITKPIQGSGGIVVNAHPSSLGVTLGSDSNTFTGPVRVQQGVLGISSNQALGDSANTLTIDGGTLRAQSGFLFSTSLVIPASRSILIGAGGATFSGRMSPNTNEALVIQTTLSGSNPIRIERRVNLSAVNTFTGTLSLLSGSTLTITSDAALGGSDALVRFEGTQSNPAVLNLPDPIILPAGRGFELAGETGRIIVIGGSEIYAGFTGTGMLQLNQIGSGTVVLGGGNTHTGGTTLLSGGYFQIAHDSAFGAPGAPLVIDGGWLKAGDHLTIPENRPTRINSSAVLVDTNGFSIVMNNNLDDGGPLPGFQVSKLGEGRFSFNGSAPEGLFVIEEGEFCGTGTIRELRLLRESVFSPGNSAGLLTVAGDFSVVMDFEFPFNVRMDIELGGIDRGLGYDALDVGGTARLDGDLVLRFIDGFEKHALAGDTFTVLRSGQLEGIFGNIQNGERLQTIDGLGSFVVHYGPDSRFDPNSVVLSDYVAVPEPAALGMVVLGAGLLSQRLRRRLARPESAEVWLDRQRHSSPIVHACRSGCGV